MDRVSRAAPHSKAGPALSYDLFSPDLVLAKGWGDANPIASNATPEGAELHKVPHDNPAAMPAAAVLRQPVAPATCEK